MLAQQLKRFDAFAHLRWSELNTVAQHTQLLCIPRGRWLLRQGRRLTGAYFLTRGRLQLWQPMRQLSALEQLAKQPFYPGASAALALTPVQLLQVDTRPIAFLLDSIPATVAGYELREEPWLARFLDSHLMRRLDTDRWQRVLRGMSVVSGERGDTLVRQGDSGDCFFVIKQGQAVVHRGRHSLAYLGAGDVFGEDALIAGAPRNASVTLLTKAELMRLPRRPFLELLVRGVVPYAKTVTPNPAHSRLLNIGRSAIDGALQVPLRDFRLHCQNLDQGLNYFVTGSHTRARALAVFLLLQRGYRAWVLLGEDAALPWLITPERYAPAPMPAAD